MPKNIIKKLVEIEAIEWTGENINEIMRFIQWRNVDYDVHNGLIIHTLEGNRKIAIGNIIIKDAKGNYCSCKPDIFWI